MKSNENHLSLMETVQQFFQEDQWNYQVIEHKSAIRAGYHGERGTWVCYAQVDEENQRFLFYAGMGLNIPPNRRAEVAEYLMRVNWQTAVGSFEMDFDTGSVRCKTSVETALGEMTVELVRKLAYINLRLIDYYFSGVLSVVHGGLSPEAALARVEAQAVEQV